MYSWPFYLDVAEGGANRSGNCSYKSSDTGTRSLCCCCCCSSSSTVQRVLQRHVIYVAECFTSQQQASTHQVVFCASLCARICLRLSSHSIRYLQTVLWSINGFTTDRRHSNKMSLCCHFSFVYTSRTIPGGGGGSKHLNVQAAADWV